MYKLCWGKEGEDPTSVMFIDGLKNDRTTNTCMGWQVVRINT
jgi:hypothetical protein